MAATMTYDSLIQDISEYTERDDQEFLDQIPRFILLAENKIAAAVKTLMGNSGCKYNNTN